VPAEPTHHPADREACAPDFWEGDTPAEPSEALSRGCARPFDRRASLIRRHRSVLLLAVAACALAFALEVLPDGRVAVRGLPQVPLPQTCGSRSLLGLKCPGCGLTRSIVYFARRDWPASRQAHRLGGLAAFVIALQVPYRLLALRRPERPLIAPRWQAALGGALVALLICNWLAEVITGRVFTQ
jgi:hypothetical protein